MSNGLVNLMQLYAEQNAKNDNSIKCVAGKVVTVTDDMFRADIELGQGQVVKDMMNKSGEKLKVGDTVWIEYFTYPSSGWIARRNGEPDPMGGGGGGSTTTVGNAAVMSTDFSDFNVTEQLMLDITPNTTLYYGASPSFMVIQGHYCLLCSTSYIVQYSNGQWTIGQKAGLYERIIANKAKFGSQIGNASGGGWLSGYSTGVAYPSRYIYEALEIYQISTTTAGNTYTAYFRLYWANTNAPSGNWWESTMSWGSFTKVQYQVSLKAANNTNYMTTLSDVFIVPVLSQYTNDATVGTLKTPYGYVNIAGYLIFSSADGTHYGVVWYPVTSGDASIARAPCVSEAEQCFALGISQRTEPVVGGGT